MKRQGSLALLVAALALPAGASAQYRPAYPPTYRGGSGPQGTVDGFIAPSRGRCLVLRDHQRRTFYLSGGTYDLRPGDHVTVREHALSRSYCGNDGPTLEVLDVQTVWTGRDHRSALFDARRDGDFAGFLFRNRQRGGWYSERYSYHQNRDQYGRDQYGRDQYGREGDRYGDRNDPNGPYGRQGRPDGQYAPPPPYDQGQPRQGQPQYEPDGQYDQNGQYDQEDDDDQNGQPPPPYDDQYDRNDRNDRSGGSKPISVDGTLEFDRSCPAVVRGDGTWYDLAGDLKSYHDGDRVHIVGLVSGSSSCGGTALEIQEIRRR